MIKKSDAHKHYPRDTQIIRKGDAGWKSDRENYQRPEGTREDKEYLLGSQRHISNPLSVMDQKIRQRASREVDYGLLPSAEKSEIGAIAEIPMANGRDMMAFRLVFDERKRWRYAYVTKNGAL